MDTAFWVGIILAAGGTFFSLFRRSAAVSSRLMKAAEKDDLARFKKLLKKRRIKINDYGMTGNRPLHIAAGKWCKEGLIPQILAKGAFVDIRNIYKQTPLHFAAVYGCLEAIQLLIENGADVNAVDSSGHTPLALAEKQRRKRPIRLLIEYGAVKAVDK